MNGQKGTRPGADTPRRAMMEAGTGQATTSKSNSTMTTWGRQIRIADLLGYGSDRGLTITDLQRLTDLSSREIRRQIEQERRSGALIISDNRNGYYLTNDPGEAQRFARSMIGRAEEIKRTALAVESAALEKTGCFDG